MSEYSENLFSVRPTPDEPIFSDEQKKFLSKRIAFLIDPDKTPRENSLVFGYDYKYNVRMTTRNFKKRPCFVNLGTVIAVGRDEC